MVNSQLAVSGKIRPVPHSGPSSKYRLLAEFGRLFEGHLYRHRASTQGDFVAMHLYEDLIAVERSPKLLEAVKRGDRVLNTQNVRRGIEARRGDGTFGEIIPDVAPVRDPGYVVARGLIATVEISVEVKVLAKAMIKQIDRVINDLKNQLTQFRRGGGHPICVAVVGINHAEKYVSYEGERAFQTTGKGGYLHPAQEATEAEKRMLAKARPAFDEFLVLRFRATNEPPYPFEWVNFEDARLDYAAALGRISSRYEREF